MDLLNQDSRNKHIVDTINTYSNILHAILDEYNSSTLKTRENLLVFTENTKLSTINSLQYCQNKLNEIDNQIADLPSITKENIEKILKKHERKIEENAKTIERLEKECQAEIDKIDTEYDIIVSMKNDELDSLHYHNDKETNETNHSLDKEESKQIKEMQSSIEDIIVNMESIKAKLSLDIENLKQDFLDVTTVSNQNMRDIRNKYISMERDFREKSIIDIGNYNKQIEENNEIFFVVQRQIINDFKQNLIQCGEEYDNIFPEYQNNPLKILEEQTINKIKRYSFEIEKNFKIKAEKEKLNTKIQNIKIYKTDYDDSLTFEINKANIKSLVEIAEFERNSMYADAVKNNQIDYDTIECNSTIAKEQKKLDEKKKELAFFKKHFALLKKYNKGFADLNSQLYDISITLELDLNQFDREYKINLEKIALKKKKSHIFFLNTSSNLEYEKETILARLDSELSAIDLEIKKIHTYYDHLIFKNRSDYNIEKTRIEHILRFFEIKLNKEESTLKNDIDFILDISSNLKKETSNLYSNILTKLKANTVDASSSINDFNTTIYNSLQLLNTTFNEYFGNKALRATADIDKMIDDYLEATKEKRIHLSNEIEDDKRKIENIENEIFSNESDIIYLESTRKSILEKGKKDLNKLVDSYEKSNHKKEMDEEIKEIVNQIDEKNFKVHILKLRLKSHTKNLTASQDEIDRIDEGTKLFLKKESQKLFDLKLQNTYYDNYDDLLEIIYSFIDNANTYLSTISSKNNKISSLYKLTVFISSRLNKLNNHVKKYYSSILNIYHEQIKKIVRVCNLNLLKEKRVLERNIISINREKEIEIEETNAKSIVAKRESMDSSLKCNNNILALKENLENEKNSYVAEENELKRQLTINVGALKENMRKTKQYYADANMKLGKKKQMDLNIHAKERVAYKNEYEYVLNRLNREYMNEKEKIDEIAKNRLINVEKQNTQKLKELSVKNKVLEKFRLKKIKIKTVLLTESKANLKEQTRILENEMQLELNNMKRDCLKKMHHEKKKMAISK